MALKDCQGCLLRLVAMAPQEKPSLVPVIWAFTISDDFDRPVL